MNTMSPFTHSNWRIPAGILASAVMSVFYVRGGACWMLGFVILVPWMRALDATRTLAGTLLCAYAMSVAFTAAVFAWFGVSIGSYTQAGATTGLSALDEIVADFQRVGTRSSQSIWSRSVYGMPIQKSAKSRRVERTIDPSFQPRP